MADVEIELDVSSIDVTLEMGGLQGAKGDKGDTGDPGITVGNTAPVNPFVGQLWVDTN